VEWDGKSRRTEIGKWSSERKNSNNTHEEKNGFILDMA
jgi:hypothetical protein